MEMTQILKDLLSDISIIPFATAFVMTFGLWLSAFYSSLSDVLTHVVDMSYITIGCVPDISTENEINVFLKTVLLFSRVDDHLYAGTTVEMQEALLNNLSSVHLVIVQGPIIKFYLFTINSDLSLTILAEGLLDKYSVDFDKKFIDINFENALTSFMDKNGPATIKLSILVATMDYASLETTPFIPLKEFLQGQDWNLFACIYGNSSEWFSITTVSDNLPRILDFRGYLADQCVQLFDMTLATSSDDQAEDSWFIMAAQHQLVRYMEAVHRIYTPIDPIDTFVSTILEEE